MKKEEELRLLRVAETMSNKIRRKFPSLPFEELVAEAVILVLDSRQKHPDKDPGLEYVSARWKLFQYGIKCLKNREKYIIPDESDDVLKMIDEDNFSNDKINGSLRRMETIMKIDMYSSLSKDAKYIVDGILSYKLLIRPEGRKKISKKEIIIYNLRKEEWTRKRGVATILEIEKWWREYFKEAC